MTFDENPELPQVSSADICRAAEIDAVTLRNWLSRSPPLIYASAGELRTEIGGRAMFLMTLRRTMQLAVISRLVGMGFAPKRAARYSLAFSDAGGGLPGDPEGRLPGQLFEGAATYLVADPNAEKAFVVAVGPETPLQKLEQRVGSSSLVTVNLDQVIGRARSALGMPYRPPVLKGFDVGYKNMTPEERAAFNEATKSEEAYAAWRAQRDAATKVDVD